MWTGSVLAGIGGQLTIVTVMLHVFALTGSTFAVSMIAVAGLVPMILAGSTAGCSPTRSTGVVSRWSPRP